MTTQKSYPRELEVAYWFSYPNMKRPSSKGFPKSLTGERGKSSGAAGAMRMINSGFASRIQVTNRVTGEVLFNAVRVKVPGLSGVYEAKIMKGEIK